MPGSSQNSGSGSRAVTSCDSDACGACVGIAVEVVVVQ